MPERRLVIDASVAVDLFAGREERRVLAAERLFRCLGSRTIKVYVPRLFLVEVAGVLVRFLPQSMVKQVIERLSEEVLLVGDDLHFESSIEAALATGSRGADAYYIGLAKTINAVLATNDRIQVHNARRAGIKAFYLLDEEEYKELIEHLHCPG